jgi:hypothetical protein
MRCRQNHVWTNSEKTSCTTCGEYGEPCTWDRAPNKRGTKPGTTTGLKKAASWKQKVSNDRERIGALIDVYLDTIHPVFPLYCERELWVGWRESTFPANSSEYASLIAMCALSAQHAQQGSLFEADEPLANFAASTQPYPDDAMHLVMGQQQPDILDLEYVRACGFLALFGIQTGDLSMIHKYLGMYHGVCARFSLHDEAQWDDMFEISVCELEMRRRLYWAMYKLEVHSACVLGHMIRLPEDQSNVDYPTGLHHPAFVPGRDGEFEDWFAAGTLQQICTAFLNTPSPNFERLGDSAPASPRKDNLRENFPCISVSWRYNLEPYPSSTRFTTSPPTVEEIDAGFKLQIYCSRFTWYKCSWRLEAQLECWRQPKHCLTAQKGYPLITFGLAVFCCCKRWQVSA